MYFCGNSLGLQPKTTARFIEEELEDWARLGVEGHFHARHPWMPYHEFLAENTAAIVGATGDNTAPNALYHVGTLIFCGTPGDVPLTFDDTTSSLGSRVVAGDGHYIVLPLALSVI